MQRAIPLAGLCLAVFLVMIGMGMVVVALPEKYLQSSGTLRSSGWLASSFALSYMLFQYPAGRRADKYGYRQVLACGCFLIAVSGAVYSFAQTPAAIYAGRFIQGAGEAPIWASAPALLGQRYPSMRGRVMGLYNAAFHIGLMLGPVIGARFSTTTGIGPFPAFSSLSLGALLIVLFTVRDSTPAHEETPAPASPAVGSNRSVWRMVCGLPLFGAVYGLFVSSFPVYLTTEAAFTQERLGTFFFSAYSGLAAGQLLAGTFSDRYGRTPFMAGGLWIISGGLVSFIMAPLLFANITAAASGFGLGVFAVSSMAFMNESYPDQRKGTASGMYYLAWGSGYFVGPLLVNLAGLSFGVLALASYSLVVSALIMQGQLALPGGKRALPGRK